jgi:hypothetical protein
MVGDAVTLLTLFSPSLGSLAEWLGEVEVWLVANMDSKGLHHQEFNPEPSQPHLNSFFSPSCLVRIIIVPLKKGKVEFALLRRLLSSEHQQHQGADYCYCSDNDAYSR